MKSNWLSEFISILPEIKDAVNQVDNEYKQILFRLLVEHSLKGGKDSSAIGPTPPPIVDDDNNKFIVLSRFLKNNDLNMNDIHNLVDLESGQIILRNLGTTNAEIQRNLAVILAIKNCALKGDFLIQKDELRQVVTAHGAYDSPNFSSNMKKTTNNGRAVYIETEDKSAWKVLPIQEIYLAVIIKKLSRNKE